IRRVRAQPQGPKGPSMRLRGFQPVVTDPRLVEIYWKTSSGSFRKLFGGRHRLPSAHDWRTARDGAPPQVEVKIACTGPHLLSSRITSISERIVAGCANQVQPG